MSTPFTSPPSNTAATVSGMVVAVGSTNPAKVKAVEAVVARSFPDARVRPVAVASGVSEQPLSADETERGARTRALSALAAVPEARFGIGLEGGVHFRRGGRSRRAVPGRGSAGGRTAPDHLSGAADPATCDVVNCCAVAAADGSIHTAWGVRFPLPPAVGRRLRNGEELGSVMDELSGVPDSAKVLGAVGFLSNGLLTRDVMWEAAVVCALMPWLHPELYSR